MENKTSIKVMLNTLYGVRPQEADIANNRLYYQMDPWLINARLYFYLQPRRRMDAGPNSRFIYADTDSVNA